MASTFSVVNLPTSLVRGVGVRTVQVQLVQLQIEMEVCVAVQIEAMQIEMVEHMAVLMGMGMLGTMPMDDSSVTDLTE